MRFMMPLSVFGLLVFSCGLAEDKDEVEAGFAERKDNVQVTLGDNFEVDEFTGTLSVDITLSGFNNLMLRPEAGLMSSTDFDFYQSSYTSVKPVDGTVNAAVSVTPGTTNWIMAVASTVDGSVYSDKVAVEVPDVPWYYKFAGTYVGDYVSAGDNTTYKNHQVYVTVSADHKYVALYNFDPYLEHVLPGYKPSDRTTNYVMGAVDTKTQSIKFSSASSFFSINNDTFQLAPIASFVGGVIKVGNSFEIGVSGDGQTLTVRQYGIFNVEGQYFEELYDKDIVLTAN